MSVPPTLGLVGFSDGWVGFTLPPTPGFFTWLPDDDEDDELELPGFLLLAPYVGPVIIGPVIIIITKITPTNL